MKIAVYIGANNDVNGNPRRAFLVMDKNAMVIDVIDEGYNGTSKLMAKYPNIQVSGRIDVTVEEYEYNLNLDVSV